MIFFLNFMFQFGYLDENLLKLLKKIIPIVALRKQILKFEFALFEILFSTVIIMFINSFSVKAANGLNIVFLTLKILTILTVIIIGINRLAQGHTQNLQNSFADNRIIYLLNIRLMM